MQLTDWLGNEYGAGDLILYPRSSGSSVEITKAKVWDTYGVLWDADKSKWRRTVDGETPEHIRVTVLPLAGSRGFYRSTEKTEYLDEDDNPTSWAKAAVGDDGYKRWRRVEVGARIVTILDIVNITALPK